jgi:hypothetical protein
MPLMQNGVKSTGIILGKRVSKPPLPIMPEGTWHINVHLEQIFLRDEPNDLQKSEGRSIGDNANSRASVCQSFQERELASHKSLQKKIFFLLSLLP